MEKFNYEENGYNREEVDNFVSEVTKNTKEIVSKCLTHEEEIKRLTEELDYYRKNEEKIKKAVEKADLLAENTKKMAEKEAQVIIKTAKDDASVIVNDSLINTQKLELKQEVIQENMRKFKEKLKILIEQQKIIVEDLDNIEIREE